MAPTIPIVISDDLTHKLINISIFVAVIIFVRYLISWFVNTLAGSRIISYSAKTVIIKVLDILVISSIVIVSIHLITASLTPYIVAVVIGVLVFTLFYYEVKEFTAFITVHLQRFSKGTWIEVIIPRTGKVLRGRIVDVQPFSSIIEDIRGNKTYIANSLLVNSIIREYRPRIRVSLKLNKLNPNSSLADMDSNIIQKIRLASSELPFRIEERSTFIRAISKGSIIITMELVPLSIPVRPTDVTKLTRHIINALSEYEPEVRVRII